GLAAAVVSPGNETEGANETGDPTSEVALNLNRAAWPTVIVDGAADTNETRTPTPPGGATFAGSMVRSRCPRPFGPRTTNEPGRPIGGIGNVALTSGTMKINFSSFDPDRNWVIGTLSMNA